MILINSDKRNLLNFKHKYNLSKKIDFIEENDCQKKYYIFELKKLKIKVYL